MDRIPDAMCPRLVSSSRVARAGRRRGASFSARHSAPAWTLRACASLLALSALFALPAIAPASERFELKAEPARLRADARGVWTMSLRLTNRTEMGLYPDSLHVHWKCESAADRPASAGVLDLSRVAVAGGPAGGGESQELQLNIPAECARGTLTLRMRLHDPKGGQFSAETSVELVGSDLEDRFPSEWVEADGRKIELVLMRPDSANWPAAALVVLPASGTRARSLLRWAQRFFDRGFAVALVSPPGAGASSGPEDRSGPWSVTAASAALARVRREPACAGRPVQLWGERQGATTALLAAAGDKALAGVVALDASHDPWADYRAMTADQKAAYEAAAGRDSAGWRARSPLDAAKRISAPVLVVHTDVGGAAEPARAFVERRAGGPLVTEARLNGSEPRPVRQADALRLALDFVMRHARASSP